MATNGDTGLKSVEADINYYPPDGPKVFYPGTAGYQKRNYDTKTVPIIDIRGAEDDFTFDKNGFQLVKNKWTEIQVDDSDQSIKDAVYPETIDMLKKLTGCSDVVIFSHQTRFHTAEQVDAMAKDLKDSEVIKAVGPTRFAHCDNSKDGSMAVLKDNLPASEIDKLTKSRWGISNVWRPIGRPVTREALALLDSQSVKEDELAGVRAEFPRPGQGAFDNAYKASLGFETAQVRASDDHRWYYISQMTPEEAWVFKQYDSKTDGRARQVPHSAFISKEDHGPPRQSIETRCLMFWDGESAE